MGRDIATYFIFLMCLLVCCQSNQDIATNEANISDIPDQVSFHATLTTTHNGELASRIKYGRMERFSSKKIIKFHDGVEINRYDAGVLKFEIRAEQATLNEVNDNLELVGKVVVKTHDGIEVFAEKLLWDEKQDIVTSDVFVTVITAEQDTINGTGFESGNAFKNWVIKEPSGVTQKKLSLGGGEPSADEK